MEKTIIINSIVQETSDAITIQFEHDSSLSTYHAGQFVNIFQQIGQSWVSRPYSFSSSPVTKELPAVTIKKVSGGLMSNYLFDNLRAGQPVVASEPMGRFALQSEDLKDRHLLFVAGGSGITPLFSMIKTVLAKSATAQATLLYGSRSGDSIIFFKQLEYLQEQYGNRLMVVHFTESCSTKNTFSSWVEGRITRDFLASIVKTRQRLFDQVYLCGPKEMMELISGFLYDLGFDAYRVFSESFGFGLNDADVAAEASPVRKKSAITFIRNGERFGLEVAENDFILQAGLNAGLALPHSCKEAMCGACKAKLLTGNVLMTENYALTDAQLRDGYVLLCSGKASGDTVTLAY